MTVKQRLIDFLRYKKIGQKKFAISIGMSTGYVNAIRVSIQPDTLHKIAIRYPELNTGWLMTGEGPMLKSVPTRENEPNPGKEVDEKNIIPLYDDVATVGGINEMVADMQGVSNPTDYIDTGDWFRDASAAIRHYGSSMDEYPSGCILAIREVRDRRLIIPGRDYVIETEEYRVTKKVQIFKEYIRAHSTNEDKYDDGSLVHQSFDIPFDLIRRMFLVLGYVVKKNGATMLYSANDK